MINLVLESKLFFFIKTKFLKKWVQFYSPVEKVHWSDLRQKGGGGCLMINLFSFRQSLYLLSLLRCQRLNYSVQPLKV